MKIFFAVSLLVIVVYSACADDLDSLYKQLTLTEKQITDLRNEYGREKQSNDKRLVRIQEAKARGNSEAAEEELKNGYASAERLNKLNVQLNDKQGELENLCNEWRQVYGLSVDTLLLEAEKEKNSKKKADIGTRLQKYQTLNTRACVQAPNMLSAEWKKLEVQSYDGPQEINQKIQLLKEISRDMSIQISRLDEQYKQAAKERLTRDRAQEFIEEGTLFEGGVDIRSRRSTDTTAEPTTTGNGPITTNDNPGRNESESPTSNVIDASSTGSWTGSSNSPKSESEYRKKRSELTKQQDDLRKKIQDFETKARMLIQP